MIRRMGWHHHMVLTDIWGESADDGSDWEEVRDKTVARFKNDGWCARYMSSRLHGLGGLIFELEETEDLDDFNEVWNDIYDWADANRLWIQVF